MINFHFGKIIYNYLGSKFVLKMVALITLQQAILGLETACIASFGHYLSHTYQLLIALGVYFFLTTISGFLSVVLKKIEMQGYFNSYANYVSSRLNDHKGKARYLNNRGVKDEFLTAIGSEAETYLTATSFSFFDLYLFLTSIVFNLVAIYVVVDKLFVLSFAFSIIFAALVYRKTISHIDQLVRIEQKLKMGFLSLLLKAWENIFIRNDRVNNYYLSQMSRSRMKTHSSIGRSHFSSENVVFLISLINSIPLFTTTLYLIANNAQNAPYLAGLIFTLPRQLQILNSFRNFLNQLTSVRNYMTRFRAYWDKSQLADLNILDRIQIGKIRIGNQYLESLAACLNLIHTQPTGRLTITGPNGVGKSTLLLYLNEQLPQSIYIPPNPQFYIESSNRMNESTGETMIKYFRYFEANTSPVYLLDEWDANLDSSNLALINNLIDRLSKKSLVLEVRHFRKN